jgi:hypothetical protein
VIEKDMVGTWGLEPQTSTVSTLPKALLATEVRVIVSIMCPARRLIVSFFTAGTRSPVT